MGLFDRVFGRTKEEQKPKLSAAFSSSVISSEIFGIYSLNDDMLKYFLGLSDNLFTPADLEKCSALPMFRWVQGASHIPDDQGRLFQTYLYPAQDIPKNIGNIAVCLAFQHNGEKGKDAAILPAAAQIGFNAGNILMVYTISCCAGNAYSAVVFSYDEEKGDMVAKSLPSSATLDKMIVGLNGQPLAAGRIYDGAHVQGVDENDSGFDHFVKHQQDPTHCATTAPGFGPGYRA